LIALEESRPAARTGQTPKHFRFHYAAGTGGRRVHSRPVGSFGLLAAFESERALATLGFAQTVLEVHEPGPLVPAPEILPPIAGNRPWVATPRQAVGLNLETLQHQTPEQLQRLRVLTNLQQSPTQPEPKRLGWQRPALNFGPNLTPDLFQPALAQVARSLS